jgi:hypothetical protein
VKLSSFNNNTTSDQLQITDPMFLHIVPDFGTILSDNIDSIGLQLSNCHGIYVNRNIIKLKIRSYSPIAYINQLAKSSPIKILNKLTTIPEKKYIIIDHTPLIKLLSEIDIAPKYQLQYIFQYLNNINEELHNLEPKFQQNILFLLKKSIGLQQILQQINYLKEDEYPKFDKHVLLTDGLKYIPFMSYDDRGNKIYSKHNLDIITKNISDEVIVDQPKEEVKPEIELPSVSNTVVNKDKLSKILKSYKINDPGLITTIQSAIDDYKNSNVKTEDHENNLNLFVLKAINHHIFNTKIIEQKYLDSPELLFKKLYTLNTFKVDLNYPDPTDEQAIKPKDIIDLDYVTGPVRHKFEFDENIHAHVKQLFSGLENKKYPIKIKNIKYNYIDDNRDRYIKYTITCQNMAGGVKEPFDLNIKLPALVNEKYFKLNGKEYILSSQMFLNPITKDKYNLTKFLTHYNMATLSVDNVRFNFADIQGLIKYVKSKYSNLVVESDDNSIKLNNGMEINLLKEPYFKFNDVEMIRDNGKFKLKIDGNISSNVNKNEYIFNSVLKQLKAINPDERIGNTKKTLPFLKFHIVGIEAPLIIYLWSQLGLLESLVRLGINFNINEDIKGSGDQLTFPLKDDKYLHITVDSHRTELILNGLKVMNNFDKFSESDLSKNDSIYDFINQKYGTRAITNFNLFTENMIDPTSKEVLKFYDYPTDVISITTGPLLDKLFEDQPTHPADITQVRLRQSEYLTHLLYNEIMMGYSRYISNISNDKSKMFLDEDYIIDNLLGCEKWLSINLIKSVNILF